MCDLGAPLTKARPLVTLVGPTHRLSGMGDPRLAPVVPFTAHIDRERGSQVIVDCKVAK
jgi:hypothetical protein